jgi:hypothetical protein
VERFMAAEMVDIPEGASIPLLKDEVNRAHPPKHYGLIRRLATDLRYQDDLEHAIFDVFAKMEMLIETMPIPTLNGECLVQPLYMASL